MTDQELYEKAKLYGKNALYWRRKFTELPVLKSLLENGEVSVNKLARVASIATPQNEVELAEQVKLLPQSALETLVKDERIQNENGLSKPLFEVKSVRAHDLELNEEVLKRLNELLLEFLNKREEEIAAEKAAIAANLPETQSRHMPVRTEKVLHKEHGTKCAIPTCKRPSEQVHHIYANLRPQPAA